MRWRKSKHFGAFVRKISVSFVQFILYVHIVQYMDGYEDCNLIHDYVTLNK